MANQRSLDELIEKAQNIHKDSSGNSIYDYSKVKFPYQNNGQWEIKCRIHSELFIQSFRKHLNGQTGCKKCIKDKKANKNKQIRKQRFIENAQNTHQKNGKPFFDYSKVEYVNNQVKVKIKCPKHGYFNMTPANHTHKSNPQACTKCSNRYVRSAEEFIQEAEKKHCDSNKNPLYDYSKIKYIDTTHHVIIYCKKHNKNFRQTPSKHLNGQKCPECSKEIVVRKNSMTQEDFIKAAQQVHKDAKGNPKYDYSEVNYKNNHTNVTIICPYHGPFSQLPSTHKDSRSGCKSCRASKGEQIISEFLHENKIKFESEYKFDDCIYKRKLPFDFKIDFKGKTVLIEYHGAIHFMPVKYSKKDIGADSRLEYIQLRDKIKNEYAKKMGFLLIEFTYRQDYDEIINRLKKHFLIK